MINESDKQFIRRVLMPYFNVRRVAVQTSASKLKFPDIWVDPRGHTPMITVTPEWERQHTDERRKRLVHEFLHLDGLDHDADIGYVSHPEQDVYSKAVYKHVTKVMSRSNPNVTSLNSTLITKERIRAEFAKNGIPIDKIRFVGDGWFVYHPYAMEYEQSHYKRTLVSDEGGKRTYLRRRKTVLVCASFIDSEDMLKMAIVEAKRRMPKPAISESNPGATALTREGYKPGYFIQTPEQRKAKYKLARELGANQSWASAIRDWRSAKIFRWAGLPVPPLKVRQEMGLVNPNIGGIL